MSLKVMSVDAEDYKFENEKENEGVELERSEVTRTLWPASPLCIRLVA